MTDSVILVLLLLLVLALLVFLVFRLLGDAPAKTELMRLQGIEEERDRAILRLDSVSAELEMLRVVHVRLEADLQYERKTASEKISLLQDSENRLQREFENLAGRIIEERGRALGEENRRRMDSLLQPFRDQLEAFRRRVDEVHETSVAGSASLREQVRQLLEFSGRVSEEANNLAKAIKGDAKVQGDWGETIIERIFEASGLEKGREYTAQESFRSDDGSMKRPDFMVILPGDKRVVVDAKVSLTAYERFCSLEESRSKEQALREHLQSVRRHISSLLEKDYGCIGGNSTLDFVIMCIPLEPAWQIVMQVDPELQYELSGKNIVLCGPATLMITLKLIAQIWRRENENRNAEQIAEKAGKIYDQVALVVEAVEDARKKLSGVSDSFDLVLRRIKEGRGNLVGRVEDIRRLGAKVNRRIPAVDEDEESVRSDVE
ncbi:MAG: DNA recombination protein RmuC [Chlorobium sp.]|jgi:DNA recombination protein RmuC|uniref:DNA recombination protein RmuC n=1 Tax=Chlorobium sp. TaxID=1095 RepID=UPI001DC34708|nr:DNA recombination protein RmuC [Chlorobium sp.]MBN1278780.1 DNA recombination protein RmuC [Chlorobiaceae bacterium]MCF8216658.1 DNA recombination protein RmuC [Chlorobium sp.]MCF8271528.1 DNA recombination protein RmuC [Chlorobium sp.]MCF8287900.1 DNA recombination protein RmuC [Chlorobium sp.]MCF8291474.1 DNA recombination protein RmuC [Chlorobium sp.]